MYCKNCGKELREGAAFCGNCGTPTGAQNHTSTVPDGKEKAAAGQGKKKGAKGLVIAILLVCVLAAVGAGGWLVIHRLNANRPDGGIGEEKEEERADLKEAEDWETAADVPEPESQEPEEAFTEEEVPEEEVPEAAGENPKTEEKRDETGIHTYELIVEDVTWTQAYQDCLDKGGYLVRINSDEEYQTILRQIGDEDKKNIKFWLGGARSSEESKDYRWVYEDGTYGDIILNEEEPCRSYWLSGEPSYSGESDDVEMYMNMFYVRKEGRWVWNDVADDLIAVADFYAGTVGYICEYE